MPTACSSWWNQFEEEFAATTENLYNSNKWKRNTSVQNHFRNTWLPCKEKVAPFQLLVIRLSLRQWWRQSPWTNEPIFHIPQTVTELCFLKQSGYWLLYYLVLIRVIILYFIQLFEKSLLVIIWLLFNKHISVRVLNCGSWFSIEICLFLLAWCN